MINIVMLVKDRPALTKQSLATLYANTRSPFNLTIVDDYSASETRTILDSYEANAADVLLLRADGDHHITGRLRNQGVRYSQQAFGRGDWLYLADNDSFFTPFWDEVLIGAYEYGRQNRVLIVGGSNHPYHQPLGEITVDPFLRLRQYHALAGTSHLMKWATWDRFGPLLETGAAGPCQSEDTALCAKIVAAGGRVGAVWPEVVYDCGITQTGGVLSPGADVKRRYEGVVYE